jgi:hypothetical protein
MGYLWAERLPPQDCRPISDRDILLIQSGVFPDLSGVFPDRLVNMALIIGRSLSLGVAMLLVACQHPDPVKHNLPGHPRWEMYARAGSQPPANCPGQYTRTIDNADGSFFLGCWGSKTN